MLADGEIVLEMPAGNCCDMRGVIGIAEKVMPMVWRITTIAGGLPDTEYRKMRGEWRSYDLRPNA